MKGWIPDIVPSQNLVFSGRTSWIVDPKFVEVPPPLVHRSLRRKPLGARPKRGGGEVPLGAFFRGSRVVDSRAHHLNIWKIETRGPQSVSQSPSPRLLGRGSKGVKFWANSWGFESWRGRAEDVCRGFLKSTDKEVEHPRLKGSIKGQSAEAEVHHS